MRKGFLKKHQMPRSELNTDQLLQIDDLTKDMVGKLGLALTEAGEVSAGLISRRHRIAARYVKRDFNLISDTVLWDVYNGKLIDDPGVSKSEKIKYIARAITAQATTDLHRSLFPPANYALQQTMVDFEKGYVEDLLAFDQSPATSEEAIS